MWWAFLRSRGILAVLGQALEQRRHSEATSPHLSTFLSVPEFLHSNQNLTQQGQSSKVVSRQNLCYLVWEGLNTARVIAQGKPGKIECQHIARKSGLTSPVGWFRLSWDHGTHWGDGEKPNSPQIPVRKGSHKPQCQTMTKNWPFDVLPHLLASLESPAKDAGPFPSRQSWCQSRVLQGMLASLCLSLWEVEETRKLLSFHYISPR